MIFAKSRIFLFLAAATTGVIGVGTGFHYLSRPVPGSPEFYLAKADEMAFNNNWIGAAPVYKTAQNSFAARGDIKHALYAEVSQFRL